AALLQAKDRVHPRHREGGAIDGPFVEAVQRRIVLGKRHLESLVRRGGRLLLAENRVVPAIAGRLYPFRLAGAPGIFDHNAHALAAVVVGHISQHPYTGVLHFHDSRDTLGGPEPEHRHFDRLRHRIAVERHDLETMTRHCEAADFRGAAVDDMKQHAFALLDADRLAMAEHAA